MPAQDAHESRIVGQRCGAALPASCRGLHCRREESLHTPNESQARIVADAEALGAIDGRFAGTEGERRMLDAITRRLPEGVHARSEGFVSHTSPGLFTAAHAVLLLICGVIGFWEPGIAAVATGILTLSLVGEGSGRFAILRWPVPRKASYNLVVRQEQDYALGSLVLAAPLDVPRWRPSRSGWLRRRPSKAVFAAAALVTAMCVLRSLAEPWGPRTLQLYVAALIVFGVAAGFGALAHRRVSGSKQDPSGPVVLLELMRRLAARPVSRVDVWFVFTGCGRAYQTGMDAFLRRHVRSLTEPVLVLALDEPGKTPLYAVASEGGLFAQHHRPTGPALLERLRWAGVHLPEVDLPLATNARAALVRGYRAVALRGGERQATPESTDRAADIVETTSRWFGHDLAHMEINRPALVALQSLDPERAAEEAEEILPAEELGG